MLSFENPYVSKLLDLASLYVKRDELSCAPYRWASVISFNISAEALGYKKLGDGFFSQAWGHPELPDYAIKLGFKKEDSGASYAAFCRDNQGLEGIPNIHGIKSISCGYVVLMDKYRGVRTSVENRKVRYLSDLLTSAYMIPTSDLSGLSGLELTIVKIGKYFQGLARFDLHNENVMVDSAGCLVITDPVSFKQYEDKAIPAHNFVHALDARLANAVNAKKPAFLVLRDERRGVRAKRKL